MTHVPPPGRFREKQWVAQTRGRRGIVGCLGTIHAVYAGKWSQPPRYVVKFGPEGPYRRLLQTSLRKAEPDEIAMMMGCRVRDLTAEDLA